MGVLAAAGVLLAAGIIVFLYQRPHDTEVSAKPAPSVTAAQEGGLPGTSAWSGEWPLYGGDVAQMRYVPNGEISCASPCSSDASPLVTRTSSSASPPGSSSTPGVSTSTPISDVPAT